jgi:Rieske Fe-S protein
MASARTASARASATRAAASSSPPAGAHPTKTHATSPAASPVGHAPAPSHTTASRTPSPTPDQPAPSSSAPAPGAGSLVATAGVPVGGGVLVQGGHVVVTQPSSGTFRAFDATCTHAGCLVNDVSGGLIRCPCHGSQFTAADGSVVAGPALAPLGGVAIAVRDGFVYPA